MPSSIVCIDDSGFEKILTDNSTPDNKVRQDWYKSSFLEGNMFDFQVTSLSDWPPPSRHVLAVRMLVHRMLAVPVRHDRSTMSALQVKIYCHHSRAIDELRTSLAGVSADFPDRKLNIALGAFYLALSEVCSDTSPLEMNSWTDGSGSFISLGVRTGARTTKYLLK